MINLKFFEISLRNHFYFTLRDANSLAKFLQKPKGVILRHGIFSYSTTSLHFVSGIIGIWRQKRIKRRGRLQKEQRIIQLSLNLPNLVKVPESTCIHHCHRDPHTYIFHIRSNNRQIRHNCGLKRC